MKYSTQEITQAREALLSILKPGDTVFTVLRHVSRSGMSRRIDLYKLETDKDGQIVKHWLSNRAAVLFGDKRSDDGLKMDGCGMDMGFEAVYQLGRILFPDGFGVEMEMPSTVTGNPKPPMFPAGYKLTPVSREAAKKCFDGGMRSAARNGDSTGWDNDGGYALKQQWL